MKPEIVAVAQAEQTEQQLIERVKMSVDLSHWTVGECAHLWTQKYARGRTDRDFAELTGQTEAHVGECRRVWSTFSDVWKSSTCGKLSWSHYRAALAWDDAAEALAVAGDCGMSVREMQAWHNMQCGTPQPEEQDSEEADDTEFVQTGEDEGVPIYSEVEKPAPQPAKKITGGTAFNVDELEPQPARKPDKPPVDLDKLWDTLGEIVGQIKARNLEEERLQLAKELRQLAEQLEGNG